MKVLQLSSVGISLVSSFLFPQSAQTSNERASCRFEDLTQNCELFRPNGNPRLALPDGTFIPNWSALIHESDQLRASNQQRVQAEIDAVSELNLERSYAVAQILDGIPSSRINARLKHFLANERHTLGSLFDGTAESQTGTIRLPWPPEDRSARWQMVPRSEARERMMGLFTEQEQEELIAINRDRRQVNLDAAMTSIFRSSHSLMDEMDRISPQRKARVEELVEYVRGRVISNLVGNRPESEWSDAERFAVDKINRIRYNSGDTPHNRNDPTCLGIVPNAFYRTTDHSINICPGFYVYPDSTLVSVIAHEMTHAIDPCNAQFCVHELDLSQIPTDVESLPAAVRNNHELHFLWQQLVQARRTGSRYTSLPFDRFDPAKVRQLAESGIIRPVGPPPPRITQDGSRLEGYVLGDVYHCLASEHGGNFRQVTRREIEESAETVVRARSAIADSSYNPDIDRRRIVEAFTRFPQCSEPQAPTQMREAISDWMGSRVLGDFLRGKNLRTAEERLAPIGFFASQVCLERENSRDAFNSNSSLEIISAARDTLTAQRSNHPPNLNRIESVLLSDPRVRAAMGCAASETTCGRDKRGDNSPRATSEGTQ